MHNLNQNCDYCGCNLISSPKFNVRTNKFCSLLCEQLYEDGNTSGVHVVGTTPFFGGDEPFPNEQQLKLSLV